MENKKNNKYNAKSIEQKNLFFVLYDWYDNFICYYDSIYDVCKALNIKKKYIVYKLNNIKNDYILIQKFSILYKLYLFDDNVLKYVNI